MYHKKTYMVNHILGTKRNAFRQKEKLKNPIFLCCFGAVIFTTLQLYTAGFPSLFSEQL